MPDMQSELNALLGQVDGIVAGVGNPNFASTNISLGVPQSPLISEIFSQPVGNSGPSPVQSLEQSYMQTLFEQALNPGFVPTGTVGNGIAQVNLTLAGTPGAMNLGAIAGGMAISQEGMNQFNTWYFGLSSQNAASAAIEGISFG